MKKKIEYYHLDPATDPRVETDLEAMRHIMEPIVHKLSDILGDGVTEKEFLYKEQGFGRIEFATSVAGALVVTLFTEIAKNKPSAKEYRAFSVNALRDQIIRNLDEVKNA